MIEIFHILWGVTEGEHATVSVTALSISLLQPNGKWVRLPGMLDSCNLALAVRHCLLVPTTIPPSPPTAHLLIFQGEGYDNSNQFKHWSQDAQWNQYHISNYPIFSRVLSFIPFFWTARNLLLVWVESDWVSFLFFHFLKKISEWEKTKQKRIFPQSCVDIFFH
jgi:hypothetical protein